tara:strand:- start:1196 stop:2641 length:1446 start_codon:yes stop_codon:yes gene_type:complete
MTRKARFNIAASSLIVASSMVGCSGAALENRAGLSAGKLDQMASSQARDAEKAIANRDAGLAIQIAEAAVAANPNDAGYRTLLGRAYLLGGRFDSAKAAFSDALTLGSKDVRTIVNLALIHTAQGHSGQARALLTDHMDVLPAADYGLAMAMAGDANEAVRVLAQAIHDPAAGVKERQNLAYSYALAGRWTEARQMASVDLSPLDAAQRVLGWAQYAQPGAESQRVIAMIGVQPRADDAGLPVRLALVSPTLEAPIRTAEADDAAIAPIAQDNASVELASTEVAPAELAPAELATADSASVEEWTAAPSPAAPLKVAAIAESPTPVTPTPVARAPITKAVEAKAAESSPFLRAKPAILAKTVIPASRPASKWQPVDPAKGSAWVVQLGAFSSSAAAQAAWSKYVRRNATLSEFPPILSTATVNGREYYRVAIAGFGDRGGANQFCATIRGTGANCFVRLGGAEAAPARWALAKKPQLMAMR